MVIAVGSACVVVLLFLSLGKIRLSETGRTLSDGVDLLHFDCLSLYRASYPALLSAIRIVCRA